MRDDDKGNSDHEPKHILDEENAEDDHGRTDIGEESCGIAKTIVKRRVRARGLPPGFEVEDVVQEILIKFWLWLRTNPDIESVAAALAKFTNNFLIDLYRSQTAQRRDHRKEDPLDDPERGEALQPAGPDQNIPGSILLQELRENLSGRDREVFDLVFIHDWLISEVAEWLGVTKQAVSARLCRMLKKFRPLV